MLPTLPEVPGWTGFLALCAGPAPWTPAGAGDVPALAPVTTRARAHAPPPVRACHHTVSPPSGNKSSENPWRHSCTAPSDVTCGARVGAERPREARRALAGARAVVAGPVT